MPDNNISPLRMLEGIIVTIVGGIALYFITIYIIEKFRKDESKDRALLGVWKMKSNNEDHDFYGRIITSFYDNNEGIFTVDISSEPDFDYDDMMCKIEVPFYWKTANAENGLKKLEIRNRLASVTIIDSSESYDNENLLLIKSLLTNSYSNDFYEIKNDTLYIEKKSSDLFAKYLEETNTVSSGKILKYNKENL